MSAEPLDAPHDPNPADALDRLPLPAFVMSPLSSGDAAITYANDALRELVVVDSATWFPRSLATVFDEVSTARMLDLGDDDPADPFTVGFAEQATVTVDHRWMLLHTSVLDGGEIVGQLTPIADPIAAERALEAEQRFRAALLELSALSRLTKDDEDFYQRLLETAVDVVPGAQAGSVQLAVPGTNSFRFVAALGYDLEGLKKYELEHDHMFRDATNPRARIIRDLDNAARSEEIREWLYSVGRLGEIVVNVSAPVVSNGFATAFLSLDNFEDPDAMTETSIDMTTVLAGLLGELLVRRDLQNELQDEREAYRELAMQDALTGIANRRHLERTLKQRLSSARGRESGSGLLFIDIDDFKSVNDRLGHEIGDALLVEVARGVKDVLRSGDMVGRWGGDEFLVLPVGVHSAQETLDLAQRILAHFEDDLQLSDDMSFRARLSIGASWSASSVLRAEQLVGAADEALYEAKSAGKGVARVREI